MNTSKSSTIKKWFYCQLYLGNPLFKGYIQRSLRCRAYCNLAVDLAIQDIWCLVEGCSGLTESFLRVNLYSVLKVFKDLFGLSFWRALFIGDRGLLGKGILSIVLFHHSSFVSLKKDFPYCEMEP